MKIATILSLVTAFAGLSLTSCAKDPAPAPMMPAPMPMSGGYK